MRKVAAIVALCAILWPGEVALAESATLGRCRMQLTEFQTEIRVHYVLRTPTARRRWRLRIFDEGVRVFQDTYRTDRDGSFGAWVRIRRRPGYRLYKGVAVDVVTRDRCTIELRT
jgi:hypothetical protein